MNLEQITPEPQRRFSEENFPFLMQAQLIEDSKMAPEEWVDKYAARFREIMESGPALFRRYLLNQEEAKEFIKKELNKPETIH